MKALSNAAHSGAAKSVHVGCPHQSIMTCHVITGAASSPRILWFRNDVGGMALPMAESIANLGDDRWSSRGLTSFGANSSVEANVLMMNVMVPGGPVSKTVSKLGHYVKQVGLTGTLGLVQSKVTSIRRMGLVTKQMPNRKIDGVMAFTVKDTNVNARLGPKTEPVARATNRGYMA
jgi:hypothetical protein